MEVLFSSYLIITIIISILLTISIITTGICSIIISSRLKKIYYKQIEIDYHTKQDTQEILNEIRKLKQ